MPSTVRGRLGAALVIALSTACFVGAIPTATAKPAPPTSVIVELIEVA